MALFSRTTRAFIYTLKSHPIQRMLDFDFVCRREFPSVVGVIHPGARTESHKAFFGPAEITIPVYRSISEAVSACPSADVLVNYAHHSNVFQSSLVALNTKNIRTVVITTEGVPENDVRRLIAAATRNNKTVIGPGTVGGVQAGAFKAGDTAGTAENALLCKLYRPGSVGLVCKSSGVLNEMCYTVSRVTDGLYEGIVVGATTYVCSTLADHVARMLAMPEIKLIVVIGEPAGYDEYQVAQLLRHGSSSSSTSVPCSKKPVVAWVLGTCADSHVMVDLRHGRACTDPERDPGECAASKMRTLREAGCHVPESFADLPRAIGDAWIKLVESGQLFPAPDLPPVFLSPSTKTSVLPSSPPLCSQVNQPSPLNPSAMTGGPVSIATTTTVTTATSATATTGGVPSLIPQQQQPASVSIAMEPLQPQQQPQPQLPQPREPTEPVKRRSSTTIVSSISDDRGDDLMYCGMPLTQVVEEGLGVGDVIALLWFKRRVSSTIARFLELTIVMLADKGPGACAAHNSIVASRSGKDLISCLASGLLTIGTKYGGGPDDASRCILAAVEAKLAPEAFVEKMFREKQLIPGIGHIAQANSPDKRPLILRRYAAANFTSHRYLDFALEVERITSSKATNLVLNLDGMLGALFLDLLEGSPSFSKEEMRELVSMGCLSGLFAFSRSIGLLGHALDQKRLKQPLFRHPYEDITFLSPL